jgi:cob(I)alamin adenosyltransferase
MGTDAPATVRQLEALRKDLEGLRNQFERVSKDLIIGVADLKTSMHAADAAMRRTERLDVAALARLATFDTTVLLAVCSGWSGTQQKIHKIEEAVAKIQHESGHH